MIKALRAARDEYAQAWELVKETVNSFGFSQQEIAEAKKSLANFVPREVFFSEFNTTHGKNMLYVIYAQEILKAFKAMNENRKRRYLDGGARSPFDFVQDVMTGLQDNGNITKGIYPIATPSTADFYNQHAYDPTQKDKKPSICPHCGVSFWSRAAGNGKAEYEQIDGKRVPEWRENEIDSPNPIKVDVGQGTYSFCGGRHEIFPIGDDSGVDYEKAMELTGKSLEQLQAEGRYRAIDVGDGKRIHFVTDEYLPVIENTLAENKKPDKPYKHFDKEWIYQEGDKWYRQCRHPIDLVSPNSYMRKSIQYYAPSTGQTSREGSVTVYKCPYVDLSLVRDPSDPSQMKEVAEKDEKGKYPTRCPGTFKDIHGVTKPPKDEDGKRLVDDEGNKVAPVSSVQCDTCHRNFDVRELEEDSIYRYVHNFTPTTSLDTPIGDSEDDEATLGDIQMGTVNRDHISLELDELMEDIMGEVERIASTLKVKGADKATEIFYDWKVNGLSLKDITNKYFENDYQLHFTECLDCGFVREEKSNPSKSQVDNFYGDGMSINMTKCPNAKNHEVQLEEEQPQAVDEADPWAAFEEEEAGPAKARPTQQEAPRAYDQIKDPYTRKALEGTNLVYHGVDGSYLVDNARPKEQRFLSEDDSRSYDGSRGVITYHIYAPAERLLSSICKRLVDSNIVHEKFCDGLEYVEALKSGRTIRAFCRK